MKNILVLIAALAFSPLVGAQEIGLLAGVHQTMADARDGNTSVDGKFNFKLGAVVNFALTDIAKFRTGLIYNQRHVEANSGGFKSEINFDYLDIPALVQFNVNETFGLFAGLVVGVNVNDDVNTPQGVTAKDPGANALIPLLSLGVNLMFQDMVGFDVYYERGLGKYADGLENYGTIGANFLYWF